MDEFVTLPVILSTILDAFSRTGVVAHVPSNATDARHCAMQEGKSEVLLSPQGFYQQRHKASSGNDLFLYQLLIPDCRLSVQGYENDGRTPSELQPDDAVCQGATEDQAMDYLQPIVIGSPFPVFIPGHGYAPCSQALSNLFPLRHYFLIYVDQALNGYSMAYSWTNYMALLMTHACYPSLRGSPPAKEALFYYKYIPK